MNEILNVLMIVGIVIFSLITIGVILAKLYVRSSKERAYVRTGFGGQKVIMDGGALVFPVLHEVIPVNMKTLRLAVVRANEGGLITQDRMRVDVEAEFYVRVAPSADSIANAAQTLGSRTLDPDKLKDLIEGKFVDALRAVAAEMTMEQLHEKRADFVQSVQNAVMEDLRKNGLELETVSLTSLDQTRREFFKADNAFDAQGLTKLTETVEAKRKQRNDIEQDTRVAIEMKNLEAEKKQFEIARNMEYARLQQVQEVETQRAHQEAEIAKQQAEQKRAAREADIEAERRVDQARILSQKAVETEDILKAQAIEISKQEQAIAVAKKSEEKSQAEAEAAKARAAMVREEEAVVTVRETAIANRNKDIALVKARESAEKDAIDILVAADAEKKSAVDRAEAIRTVAQANADEVKIRAEADEKRYAVEAAGTEAINQAKNLLGEHILQFQYREIIVGELANIIKESVKPMERIDSIKILQAQGLFGPGTGGGSHGNGAGNVSSASAGNESLADSVTNAALRYRAQSPLVDSLLKELGLDGGDINGLTRILNTAKVQPADEVPPPSPVRTEVIQPPARGKS
jgi:uncharacterized membrane protein YqiK